MTILVLTGLALWVAGCGGDAPTPAKKTVVTLKGQKLRVSLEAGSPLKEALRNGLNEFEARTGSTVELAERPTCDLDVELCVLRGDHLWKYPDLPPLGKPLLESKALDFGEFPSSYRTCLCDRNGQPVAAPLGVDETLLWFRADLFENKSLAEEFKKQNGVDLAVPKTWTELCKAAEFLKAAGKLDHGCTFARDGSPESLRSYLVIAASYAKGPRWSSFLIDTENAKPRLNEPPFAIALDLWLKLVSLSPADAKSPMTDLEARRVFVEGKSAFVLSNVPPTIDIRGIDPKRSGLRFDCTSLPGSDQLFSPRATAPVMSKTPNRCAHHGSGGWFLALGNSSNRPAAERLLQFLASGEEGVYLVQAAKRGFVPVRSRLLNEPARFASYGLAAASINRFFATVAAELRSENWVADLRLPESEPLEKSLWKALTLARGGALKPHAALEGAQIKWQKIIAPNQSVFLRQLRDSLALPITDP